MQRTRYGSVHLSSSTKMYNFSRTSHNRQLIQFARIPVEFVVRFIRFSQNCVKVITFSTAAKYLLLISSYNWCLRDLRLQCLELYTACIFSQYHWDKAFHFPGKFHFLVKTITDSVRLGVVYWNFVLNTASGAMYCDIYLQSAAHITTIHDLFIYFIFNFFFTDPQSPIPDSRSPILHPRSSILAPGFPVNLEVLLIKIVIFSTTKVINCSKAINTFKR